jgi:hypothetical protein
MHADDYTWDAGDYVPQMNKRSLAQLQARDDIMYNGYSLGLAGTRIRRHPIYPNIQHGLS